MGQIWNGLARQVGQRQRQGCEQGYEILHAFWISGGKRTKRCRVGAGSPSACSECMSATAHEGMARGLACPAGVKDECQERSLLNPALSSWNTEAPLALSPHAPHPSHLQDGA